MKILFLDQSGQLGGGELSLLDVARPYRESCLVGLFSDGPFRERLEQQHIPVRIFTTTPIPVGRESHFIKGLRSLRSLIPLIVRVARTARSFDIIYANTQKALVVGAFASLLSRRPLIYHLRDILSADHFSPTNRRLAVTLANRFASLTIANSQATRTAFIQAGGRSQAVEVVYNGFEPENYQIQEGVGQGIRQQFGLQGKFIVGHFSRLSPWKGQHILIEALARCSDEVVAIFVGDALFGENDYVRQLQQKVTDLHLQERVRFLGFRSEVVPLMAACDLVVHTSTSPEPFGRTIAEAMLCGKPIVATAAGGAMELVEGGRTGWLVAPGEVEELAKAIATCQQNPDLTITIAQQGQKAAKERFLLSVTHQRIADLLDRVSCCSG